MKRALVASSLVLLVACSESVSTGPSALAPQATAFRIDSRASVSGDPYWTAVPYTQYGVFDSLSVSRTAFAADPESITDQEFDDIGAQEIDASEEISYESDGLYVESATAGGGGGGGEEPEFVSSFFGHCEDQYGRNARRCRRVWTRKGKALCWAAIMVVYADCRYNES
jgi:hypothetical protein